MSGVHRFLSRRDKKQHPHHSKDPPQPLPEKAASKPDHFGGLFTLEDADTKKPDKEEEKKIKAILARLHSYGIEHFVEANVEYALRSDSTKGDPEAAFKLLMLLEDTYEGIVRPFSPETKLLGAVNRESVTCYLDALLFAMFARLDSFEAMLYENFEDIPRRKLAGILRLWVNMLRSGKLITTDVTKHLQESLAECGWDDAAKLRQQDPSEAFGFITGKLELPLLTLKMDLYHTGKDDQDDHRFVTERLLEVAIAEQPSEGNSVLTLEDCLEQYFNNRIEVKRHMEAQRRNTLQNARIEELKGIEVDDEKKESGMHVEVAEIPGTPAVSTPVAEAPNPDAGRSPTDKLRPGSGRKRADSIFSQRKVELTGVDLQKTDSHESKEFQDIKGRKLSTKTEVLMPAWQFFKLLPWYTDHMPTSDAQVAAHFSRKRPVLGICLKRYSYTNAGEATRLNTYVDIPLEIAVPNFVSDDNMQEDGPLVGNFRLLLQSVVCHRGVSVNSGHYVTLARGQTSNASRQASAASSVSDAESEALQDPWLRFDDLARERVSYVDIHQALREEMPYLLFYQVQPIGDDGHSIHDLPSYAEATSRNPSDALPLEKPGSGEASDSDGMALTETISESATRRVPESTTEAADFGRLATSARPSIEIPGRQARRGRSSASLTRNGGTTIVFDEGSFAGSVSGGSVRTSATGSNSVPATPVEEKGNAFLAVAKSLGSRRTSRNALGGSRSRPASRGPEDKDKDKEKDGEKDGKEKKESASGRFSLNMAKLTARMSRADMRDSTSNSNGPSNANSTEAPLPQIQPSAAVAAELAGEKDVSAPASSVATPIAERNDPSPEYVAATPPQTVPGAEKAGTSRAPPGFGGVGSAPAGTVGTGTASAPGSSHGLGTESTSAPTAEAVPGTGGAGGGEKEVLGSEPTTPRKKKKDKDKGKEGKESKKRLSMHHHSGKSGEGEERECVVM